MPRVRKAKRGEGNYPVFDRYSVVHGVVGGMMGLSGISFGTTFAASVLWELAEPTMKRNVPEIFPKSTIDTPQNKVGDTASLLFGWWLVKKAAEKKR